MLIACSLDCFLPQPLDSALAEIRAVGLPQVEWPLAPGWATAGVPDEATVDAWQSMLAGHGLGVAAANISGGDPADPEEQARLERRLAVAQRLGAKVVIASAGAATDEAARRVLLVRHRRLGDRAQELGLKVAFDTLPGLCGDSREMLRTIQELDHPALRLAFDTGGYLFHNPGSSGEVALQRVCGWLACVRVTDYQEARGEPAFPPLGQGMAVDFARTLEILRPLRFRGPCVIRFSAGRRGREPTLAACREGLARSIARLRRVGWFEPE